MEFLSLIAALVVQSGLRYTLNSTVKTDHDQVVVSFAVWYQSQVIFTCIVRDEMISRAEILIKQDFDDGYRDFTPRERAELFMLYARLCA